jgi:hypothetical protein
LVDRRWRRCGCRGRRCACRCRRRWRGLWSDIGFWRRGWRLGGNSYCRKLCRIRRGRRHRISWSGDGRRLPGRSSSSGRSWRWRGLRSRGGWQARQRSTASRRCRRRCRLIWRRRRHLCRRAHAQRRKNTQRDSTLTRRHSRPQRQAACSQPNLCESPQSNGRPPSDPLLTESIRGYDHVNRSSHSRSEERRCSALR